MSVAHHPARNDCRKGKPAKKPQGKNGKKPKPQFRVVALGENNQQELIGDPVTNQGAAIRRARAARFKDLKLTIAVVEDGHCIHAIGPDREVALHMQF